MSSSSKRSLAGNGQTNFTESLILAQDERWRRVIDQGGVKVEGRPLEGYDHDRSELAGATIQAGKRLFFRLRDA